MQQLDLRVARRALADCAPLFALPAFATILLAPGLAPEQSFWYRDIYGYWAMQAESFVRAVAGGSLPLWNPSVSFGLPMLADPSYQVAYPFTWLNLVLDLVTFYRAYALFHVAWAGIGLYAFLAAVGLGRWAACAGAAAWIASGPFLVVVSHAHHFAGTSWVPWVLLAFLKAMEAPSLRALLGLGAASAAQVLAGSGDLCLMTALACTLLGAARASTTPTTARTWRRWTTTLLGAGAVALGLSALQWLPTVAMLGSGQRLGMTDATRTYWSLHPASLADFLVRGLVADLPLSASARAALFESREPLFAALYLGASTFVVAVLGALQPGGALRRLGLVGLPLAALLALGRHTPLYGLLSGLTPLGLLRFPSKYVILVGLLWSMLVALGFEAWFRGDPARRRVAAGAGLVLAAALLAAGSWFAAAPGPLAAHLQTDAVGDALAEAASRLRLAGGLLAVASLIVAVGTSSRLARVSRLALPVVVLAELAVAGRAVNPPGPAMLLTGRPSWSERIPLGSRLYVAQSHASLQLGRLPEGWTPAWAGALARIELAWPPLGARAGYTGSFDGDFTGLAPPLVSNLTLILGSAEGSPLATRLLRLAGVEYVVSATDVPWPGLEAVAEVGSLPRRPIRLFRLPGPKAEAYFVGRARLAGEPRSVLLLRESGFDPTREAVVAGSGPDRGRLDAVGSVRTVSRRADRVELEVESDAPGFVVVAQTWDEGWLARVDAEAAELLRANVLFQAVHVPAGRRRVVLEYRPASVVLGAAISCLAGLAFVGAAAFRGVRRPG